MSAHILAQLLDAMAQDTAAVARLHDVMKSQGLDLQTMVQQGAKAPLRWLREVYPDLCADQAAQLGFAGGDRSRLTSYSPLSLALVSAGSIQEVLRLLTFLPLLTNSLTARFVDRDDYVKIMLTAHSGDAVLDRVTVFYCAAALLRLVRILGPESLELTIHVAWPRPAGFEHTSQNEPGGLRFDALFHHIVVPRRVLEAVCRFGDPIAYQNELANLEAKMVSLGSADDVGYRLKELLGEGDGLVSIESAATQLHMSVSTLKRRLAEAGTSFREIRESVLRDRAMLMLAEASLTLESIAGTLGYSDLAGFSHAFKRWTGTSPGVFRRRSAGRGAK